MHEVPRLPRITAVDVIGDHALRLTFDDGIVGDVAFDDAEWPGVLAPLRDSASSRKCSSTSARWLRQASSTSHRSRCTRRRRRTRSSPPPSADARLAVQQHKAVSSTRKWWAGTTRSSAGWARSGRAPSTAMEFRGRVARRRRVSRRSARELGVATHSPADRVAERAMAPEPLYAGGATSPRYPIAAQPDRPSIQHKLAAPHTVPDLTEVAIGRVGPSGFPPLPSHSRRPARPRVPPADAQPPPRHS